MKCRSMSDSEESEISPKNYRWPLFVGVFVVLWVLFTMLWMVWGASQTKKEKEHRRQMDSFGNQLEQINRADDHE